MQTLLVYDDTVSSASASAVARHVAAAFHECGPTEIVPVSAASPAIVAAADFLVVGGSNTSFDGPPEGDAMRRWFAQLPDVAGMPAAAYDVHASAPGRCAEGLHRQLHLHHFHVIAPPGSFAVDESGALRPRDADRAQQWSTAVCRWFSTVTRRSAASRPRSSSASARS